MKLRILASVLSILFSAALSGQNLQEVPRESKYTYIYQLLPADMAAIYETEDFDVDVLLGRQPVDSFPSAEGYQKQLPFGNFGVINAFKDKLHFQVFNNPAFIADFQERDESVNLYIRSRVNGEQIQNARIWVHGKEIPFDKQLAAYRINTRYKKEDIVKIIYQNNIHYTSITKMRSYFYQSFKRLQWRWRLLYPYYQIRRPFIKAYYFWYKSKKTIDGYIAFNKPMYLPGDTVKWKAFLVDGVGRPLTKDAHIVMSKNYSTTPIFNKKTSPITEGAYIGELILGDTLTIDQKYRLSIIPEKFIKDQEDFDYRRRTRYRKLKVYNSFELKDYELESAYFDLRTDSKEYTKGQAINLYLIGKDGNENNLLDATAEILIFPEFINKTYPETLFVPDTLWKHKIPLDPVGETKITLPDSILLNARYDLNIKVTFNTSNFEQHIKEKNIHFDGENENILLEDNDLLLSGKYWKDNKYIDTTALLYGMFRSDTIIRKNIRFPFDEKISSKVDRYIVTTGDITSRFSLNSLPDMIVADGTKQKDTVKVEFYNPREIPIHYTIFDIKRNIIDKGNSRQAFFNWIKKDNSSDSYFVKYEYMWEGEYHKKDFAVHTYEKILNIQLHQPKKIQPGEEATIEIEVKDYKGKAVEQTNLTAGAISTDFKENNIPTPPYNDYHIGALREKYNYDIYDVSSKKQALLKSYKLTNKWQKRTGVDTMLYYQMRYPKDGFKAHYDSIDSPMAEFSPFIVDNGQLVPIYVVLLDETPVYYYQAVNNRYAFQATPGFYNIRIRTREREYVLKNILLIEHCKLDMSIDQNYYEAAKLEGKFNHRLNLYTNQNISSKRIIDNLLIKNQNLFPATLSVTKREPAFTNYERTNVARRLLIVNNNFNLKDVYFWQHRYVAHVQNDYSNELIIGPLTHPKINFGLVNGYTQKIELEPDFKYTIEENQLKLYRFQGNKIPLNLPAISFDKKMGERCLVFTDSVLSSPIRKKEITQYIPFSIPNEDKLSKRGRISFNYQGDSTFYYINYIKLEKGHKPLFIKGNNRFIAGLYPGYYQFAFVTKHNDYIFMDSVLIRENGKVFQKISDKDFVQKHKFSILPFTKFQQEQILKSRYSDYYDNADSINGIIEGRIIYQPENKGIANVQIKAISEQNITYSAFSDSLGFFSIPVSSSGLYVIKTFSSMLNDETLYAIFLDDHQNLNLTIYLSAIKQSLEEFTIVEYSVPLIDMGGTTEAMEKQFIYKMANRGANSVVATMSGVQSQDGTISSVRGESGSVYYIDGIKVSSSSIPQSAIEEIAEIQRGGLFATDSTIITDDNKQRSASSLRTNFKDYAYWEPNLVTDENGKASFKVKFPDNITQWKSFVIGMDDKRNSGMAFAYTKATKELMGQLATPRFLIEGDECNIIGKALNYSDSAKQIRTAFYMEGQLLSQKDTLLKHGNIESVNILAPKADSLEFTYTLTEASGYMDGEKRSIPLFPVGIEESIGMFKQLDGNTQLHIPVDSLKGACQVYIQGNALGLMLEEIDKLKNYPYYCMEQSASKLKGLLMEERIKQQMGVEFYGQGEIAKLIQRLEKGQKDDGSWGWWPNSPRNIWMTAYVTRALSKAKEQGYECAFLERGVQFLKWEINLLEGNELLAVLSAFAEGGVKLEYEKFLPKLENDSVQLSEYQKLSLMRIRQQNDMEIVLDTLLAKKKETMFGNIYWGEYSYHWYNNSTQLTLLAYQIIEAHDPQHPYLEKIRNYFMELRRENKWRNTMETASILETILPGFFVENNSRQINPMVVLSGGINQTITQFPYQYKGSLGDAPISISKKGIAPVYFTVYRKEFNPNPAPVNDPYQIKTWFEQEGKITDSLIAGKPVELILEVNAQKSGQYVMIEVPIPAACSYGDNKYIRNYYEIHREYFKQKTSIFCERLPAGTHQFKIRLEPRYSGKYTLNPAKAELMYFPTFYGRNAVRKVVVE